MNRRANKISQIQELLQAHSNGLTINDISKALSLNRISTARYLESLLFSGQAEMRKFGCAKVYTLASRMPISRILDLCSSPIAILDDELFIRSVNSHILELFDREQEDLVGHNLRYTVFSDILAEFPEQQVKMALEGRACSLEKTLEIKGKKNYFLIKLVPVIQETGRTGVALILNDCTEIKQYQYHLETMIGERTAKLQEANERLRMENEGHIRAKEDIRASQQKYRALVEDMPASICTFEPDGTLTFVNDNFCRLFGKEAEDLIGSSLFAGINPEDLTRLKKSLDQISPSHQSLTDIKSSRNPEGILIWLQWTTRAFFDKHGRIIEYQSIGIDVSVRIRTEQDLADQRAKLDAIIRGSPLPQVVIDTSHRIVSWNTALERFSGVPADSMLWTIANGRFLYGQNRPILANLIVDENIEEITRLYPLISRESRYLDEVWTGITLSTAHSEKGNWIHFTATAIRDKTGKITHVVETLEDLVEYPADTGRNLLPAS